MKGKHQQGIRTSGMTLGQGWTRTLVSMTGMMLAVGLIHPPLGQAQVPPIDSPRDGNSRPAGSALRPDDWFPRRSERASSPPTLRSSNCFAISPNSLDGSTRSSAGFRAIVPPRTLAAPLPHNTHRSRPTIYVNLPPFQPGADTTATLLIENAHGGEAKKLSLNLASKTGVVGLRLPATMALETGLTYQWTLSLDCDPSSQTKAESIIVRKSGLNVPQGERADVKSLEAFAQADLWYDAIDTLVAMLRQNPEDPDLQAAWAELMQAEWVGLEELANEPPSPEF